MAASSNSYTSDADALRAAHQFLWDGDEKDSYENKLAKSYDSQLDHQYAVGDFSRYRDGEVGLRWRTQSERFDGKGQFSCGNLSCSRDEDLTSFEVPFAFSERGERKQALVKLRLCPKCSKRLKKSREKASGSSGRSSRREEKKKKHSKRSRHERQ